MLPRLPSPPAVTVFGAKNNTWAQTDEPVAPASSPIFPHFPPPCLLSLLFSPSPLSSSGSLTGYVHTCSTGCRWVLNAPAWLGHCKLSLARPKHGSIVWVQNTAGVGDRQLGGGF